MSTHTATITSPILATLLRETQVSGIKSLRTHVHFPKGEFNLYGGTDGKWIGYKWNEHGELSPSNVGQFTADAMFVASMTDYEVVFSIIATSTTPDITNRALKITDSYGNTETSELTLQDGHYIARFIQPAIVKLVKHSIAMPYSFDLQLSESQIINDLKTMLETYIDYVLAGHAETQGGWVNGQIILYTYHVKLLRLTNFAFNNMMEYTLQRFTEEPIVFDEERLYVHNRLLDTTIRNIEQFEVWIKLGLLNYDNFYRSREIRRLDISGICSKFIDPYDSHQIRGWLES